MDNFEEIKNRFRMFHGEFLNNIRDNFGESISNDGLTTMERNINMLCNHEIGIDIELSKVNALLVEARNISPDLGT